MKLPPVVRQRTWGEVAAALQPSWVKGGQQGEGAVCGGRWSQTLGQRAGPAACHSLLLAWLLLAVAAVLLLRVLLLRVLLLLVQAPALEQGRVQTRVQALAQAQAWVQALAQVHVRTQAQARLLPWLRVLLAAVQQQQLELEQVLLQPSEGSLET
jgi:hypothetical protein